MYSVKDGAAELLDEPLLGLLLGDLLELANTGRLLAALGNSVAGALEHDVEVHTENTSVGIVLDAEIDVLVNTETKVAVIGEVSLAEFEFLNLEATLDELLSLVAADGDVDGDLLVSLYGESSDSVAGTGLDGLLVGEILEYLGGLGQLIARLTSAQVEDELFNLDLSHFVVELDLRLLLWFHRFRNSPVAMLAIGAVAGDAGAPMSRVLETPLCNSAAQGLCKDRPRAARLQE